MGALFWRIAQNGDTKELPNTTPVISPGFCPLRTNVTGSYTQRTHPSLMSIFHPEIFFTIISDLKKGVLKVCCDFHLE